MSKLARKMAWAALATASLTMAGTASAGLLLPGSPGCMAAGSCLVFDDMTVYSLPYLNYQTTGNVNLQPGSTYDVLTQETGPHASQKLWIATGQTSTANNQDLLPGKVDNGFVPGGAGHKPVFYMNGTMEPSPNLGTHESGAGNIGPFTINNPGGTAAASGVNKGDTIGITSLWDVYTSGLRSYLNGSDLVFYFSLNETGSANTLAGGQDLLGWMRVYLWDSTGKNAAKIFTLSGKNPVMPDAAYAQDSNSDILPTADDSWAHVHGEICVDSTPARHLVHLGSCTGSDPASAQTVNQNLGSNNFAFALFNSELNDFVRNHPEYDMLSVDARMGYLDNGFDQLAIMGGTCVGDVAGCTTHENPEPGALALTALALLGLAAVRRRAYLH